MPNFKTNNINNIKLPQNIDGVEFLWEVKTSDENYESLIYTRINHESFFIKKIKKQNHFLVKYDKLTKVSHIALAQNALKAYAKLMNANLLFENIYTKKHHEIKKNEFLKDIQDLKNFNFKDKKVCLEIGFGSARHILYKAKKYPDRIFLGIEIHKPSIAQALKQIKIQNLNNIFIFEEDARILLQAIPSNSLHKIYLHFPIPWEKQPHRRVISEFFFKQTQRVLDKFAKFELRTDNEEYFLNAISQILYSKDFTFKARKNKKIKIQSKYEARWVRQKKDFYNLVLKNLSKSLPINELKLLNFDNFDIKDLSNICNFKSLTIKEDEYFIHFEKMYKNEDTYVIRISFGAFFSPLHLYLIIKNDKISYFPNKVLKTYSNDLSHERLREFF